MTCKTPSPRRGRGRPRQDLTGRVFGRLTVTGPAPDYRARPHWQCRCACGRTAIASSDNLRAGTVRSCGCLRDEAAVRTLAEMAERRPG